MRGVEGRKWRIDGCGGYWRKGRDDDTIFERGLDSFTSKSLA